MRKNTTLIAGPTASGKSALALKIAKETDGVVVNADSMQVYDVLQVLTARPSTADMQGVKHLLFGHVPPSRLYSTGAWLADVKEVLDRPELAARHLIFVGGTGLYFKALLGGLSEMPSIPDETRNYWRRRLAVEGPESLHAELSKRDTQTADRLKPQDGQRIVRAIEVFEASGRPISFWQNQTGDALIDPTSSRKICLLPERSFLNKQVNQRFQNMMNLGALEEVRALLALNLDPALPAMKAIGVKEISRYLIGNLSLESAIELASTATRQYAKRQTTWLRHQFSSEWEPVVLSELQPI